VLLDREIIIDALRDYRGWFEMGADDESDRLVVDRIDDAIEWVTEQKEQEN
jgi:hypothetical protein